MRKPAAEILILLACIGMTGCMPHIKEVDSYGSEFRDTHTYPESVVAPPQRGDPYAFGGIAEGSGGLSARQSYATDTTSPDPRDSTPTGQLGQIDKQRVQVPGSLPGTPGTLPGTTGDVVGSMGAPASHGSQAGLGNGERVRSSAGQ